jgi:hypothetical protein
MRAENFPEPHLTEFSQVLQAIERRCAGRDQETLPSSAIFYAVPCPNGPRDLTIDRLGASAVRGRDVEFTGSSLALGDVTGDGKAELVGSFECVLSDSKKRSVFSVVVMSREENPRRVGQAILAREGSVADGVLQVRPVGAARTAVVSYRLTEGRFERVP